MRLLLESFYGDYIMLMQAPAEMMHLSFLPSQYLQKAAGVKPSQHSADAGSDFMVDEMTIEMEIFSRTHKATLLGVLHCATHVDINFCLGRAANRGFAAYARAKCSLRWSYAKGLKTRGSQTLGRRRKRNSLMLSSLRPAVGRMSGLQ